MESEQDWYHFIRSGTGTVSVNQKASGARVGALAGKPQHAQRHVNARVQLLIAPGTEAGGHTDCTVIEWT